MCRYDTSKRLSVKFGSSTTDEMCIDFLSYWPVQTDQRTGHQINICSFVQLRLGAATLCGDNSRFNEMVSPNFDFPFVPNPAFEDTVGAPSNFSKPGTCRESPASSLSPSEEPQTSSSPSPVAVSTTPEPVAPSPTPPVSESPEPTDSGETVCFPASATVLTRDGRAKRMDALHVGEEVLVAPGKYSPVFAFSHADALRRYSFLRLHLSAAPSATGGKAFDAVLTLTAGHLLYVNGGALVRAREVHEGDWVWSAQGHQLHVVDVSVVQDVGLYNPQTLHGDIVVDGVVASTFTEAVLPRVATAWLAPLRLAYKAVGLDASAIMVWH